MREENRMNPEKNYANFLKVEELRKEHPEMGVREACEQTGITSGAYSYYKHSKDKVKNPVHKRTPRADALPKVIDIPAKESSDDKLIIIVTKSQDLKNVLRDIL